MKKITEFILENNNNIQILPIQEEDKEEIIELCINVMSAIDPPHVIRNNVEKSTNWNISVKSVIDGKIVGCYLLTEKSVIGPLQYFKYEGDITKYEGKRSLQGLLLAVLPEYRDIGAGRKLRERSVNMGYDYIWGYQNAKLNNVDKWVASGRKVLFHFVDPTDETVTVYITILELNL